MKYKITSKCDNIVHTMDEKPEIPEGREYISVLLFWPYRSEKTEDKTEALCTFENYYHFCDWDRLYANRYNYWMYAPDMEFSEVKQCV